MWLYEQIILPILTTNYKFGIEDFTCFCNPLLFGYQENHVFFIKLVSKSIAFQYKISKDLKQETAQVQCKMDITGHLNCMLTQAHIYSIHFKMLPNN